MSDMDLKEFAKDFLKPKAAYTDLVNVSTDLHVLTNTTH